MNIDVLKLLTRVEEEKKFKIDVCFKKEDLKEAGILELKNVVAEGRFFLTSANRIELEMNISGIMVLPCSITLKPVDYHFSTNVEGDYIDLMEEIEEKNKKIENTLDISSIIWENILMEIPLKVTSETAYKESLEGNGWKFISDEEV